MDKRRPEMVHRSGVLAVNKPAGPTSHDVVDRLRRLLNVRKVGHAGTLDPAAEGLLILCIDGATRFSGYLSGLDKTYRATLRLGSATATDDGEGEVLTRYDGELAPVLAGGRLEEAVGSFVGESLQLPPAYSAKKVEGVPAYKLARRGESPRLEPAAMHVERIEITGVALPDVSVEIDCSSGFYLRALARDLGRKLGCGAHLANLVRTRIGDFTLERAVWLGDLVGGRGVEIVDQKLVALENALSFLPAVRLSSSGREKVWFGRQVALGTPDVAGADETAGAQPPGLVQMQDAEGGFLGVALVQRVGRQAGSLRPRRLLREAFPHADAGIQGR